MREGTNLKRVHLKSTSIVYVLTDTYFCDLTFNLIFVVLNLSSAHPLLQEQASRRLPMPGFPVRMPLVRGLFVKLIQIKRA